MYFIWNLIFFIHSLSLDIWRSDDPEKTRTVPEKRNFGNFQEKNPLSVAIFFLENFCITAECIYCVTTVFPISAIGHSMKNNTWSCPSKYPSKWKASHGTRQLPYGVVRWVTKSQLPFAVKCTINYAPLIKMLPIKL